MQLSCKQTWQGELDAGHYLVSPALFLVISAMLSMHSTEFDEHKVMPSTYLFNPRPLLCIKHYFIRNYYYESCCLIHNCYVCKSLT